MQLWEKLQSHHYRRSICTLPRPCLDPLEFIEVAISKQPLGRFKGEEKEGSREISSYTQKPPSIHEFIPERNPQSSPPSLYEKIQWVVQGSSTAGLGFCLVLNVLLRIIAAKYPHILMSWFFDDGYIIMKKVELMQVLALWLKLKVPNWGSSSILRRP